MPRFHESIPIDDYVLDVLLRDIVGHDRQPAAFLLYLYLYGQAARTKWRPVVASLRALAAATGLSKSAVQAALENLRRRELIATSRAHATATPRHRVLRHWRAPIINRKLVAHEKRKNRARHGRKSGHRIRSGPATGAARSPRFPRRAQPHGRSRRR